jgi:hypothetical protein
MLTAFASLKPLVVKTKRRVAFADSPVFCLHYSFTVAALAGAAVLACGKDWFGGAIHCAFNKPLFPQEFIDAFCWANSTYHDGADEPVSFDCNLDCRHDNGGEIVGHEEDPCIH